MWLPSSLGLSGRIIRMKKTIDPTDLYRQIQGKFIRDARERLIDSRTGGGVAQAPFYEMCQNKEREIANSSGTVVSSKRVRRGVSFPSHNEDNQRKFISNLEHGKSRLAAGQLRIIELVFGWPIHLLDNKFDSEIEYLNYLTLPSPHEITKDHEEVATAKPKPKRRLDLEGIRLLTSNNKILPSRLTQAAAIQSSLVPDPTHALNIFILSGEAGIGKSQLISEWWKSKGEMFFKQDVFTLDCSLLGGDAILARLSERFVGHAVGGSYEKIARALRRRMNALIVLDGLSNEIGDPLAWRSTDGKSVSPREGNDFVPTAGLADRTALIAVREMIAALGAHGARASILLGVQSETGNAVIFGMDQRLNASVRINAAFIQRLEPQEGAQLIRDQGVDILSERDLRHLSARLQGLPISLVAAAHYLRNADIQHVEAFLTELEDRDGDYRFFEEFFGKYLEALARGRFDARAHPLAYLRLLALMSGPVQADRLDDLMATGRIKRLEEGSTAKFERMGLPFVTSRKQLIDINPMFRSLLRDQIARITRKNQNDYTLDGQYSEYTNAYELLFIHATAASWYVARLSADSNNISVIDIEIIEWALFHLLSLRKYLRQPIDISSYNELHPIVLRLLTDDAPTEAVTKYCVQDVALKFLMDKAHRVTRYLGQFESKARILSLFMNDIDEFGLPKFLSIEAQITIYREIGICWMHAGRLQLANDSLVQARQRLPASTKIGSPAIGLRSLLAQDGKWRVWTDTVSTQALIAMRRGRDRELVESYLSEALKIADTLIREAYSTELSPTTEQIENYFAAKRVSCRWAQVLLEAGDLAEAQKRYEQAIFIDQKFRGEMLIGDALRRYIEVLVRRGPCIPSDLALADRLITQQIEIRKPKGVRRHLSNDIIPMFTTKIMLLRVQGEFLKARELLEETNLHEFVLRGECSFTARIELEMERFRLCVATMTFSADDVRALELLMKETEARHHYNLYWDALIVLAEMTPEPLKSRLLIEAEAGLRRGGWLRRQTDIGIIREGGSAVMAMGC